MAAAQAHCVVVDYDCPERSGDWVAENHPGVEVVRERGQRGFNLSRARNLGAAATAADWIVFLDADVVPSAHFIEAVTPLLLPERFLRTAPQALEFAGTCICWRSSFLRVSGYDEAFEGWGGEDIDLYRRLIGAGVHAATFPAHLLRGLQHGDADRTRHYQITDVGLSKRLAAAYLRLKVDLRALTGTEPGLDIRRALYREVRRVLGQSLPAGKEARIDLDLPDGGMLPQWGVRRTLAYSFPPAPADERPESQRRNSGRPPVPFIVGTGRCGSTLLRLMLDSHPELAIPDELIFLPALVQLAGTGAGPDELVQLLRHHRSWPSYQVDAARILEQACGMAGSPIEATLRAFYESYAARFGKRRYGDKTIVNVQYIALHRELFPEARFIHLVRDGRDVAVSMRGLWWGFRSHAEAASHWASVVGTVRAEGALSGNYLEVRYEDLVRDPETVLRRICDFIELPWDERMLRYRERAASRLDEIPIGTATDGSAIPAEVIRRTHLLTSEAPTDSRIGRWREVLTPPELRQFELLAGPLLIECGYLTAP